MEERLLFDGVALQCGDVPPRNAEHAAVVQPDLPAAAEWTSEAYAAAKDTLVRLSKESLAAGAVDVVLWPETPGPIFYETDPDLRARVAEVSAASRGSASSSRQRSALVMETARSSMECSTASSGICECSRLVASSSRPSLLKSLEVAASKLGAAVAPVVAGAAVAEASPEPAQSSHSAVQHACAK